MPNTIDDFYERVMPVTECGCWLWMGGLHRAGDDYFCFGKHYWLAHKFAYEKIRGLNVPKGKELDHVCHMKACVNPWHVEPVTHQENMERAKKTHCSKGHPYNKNNTYFSPKGWRTCKTCKSQQGRVYYQRRKENAKATPEHP